MRSFLFVVLNRYKCQLPSRILAFFYVSLISYHRGFVYSKMDPPSHYTLSDHWSNAPFTNIADRSTAPEPLPSTSQLIDPSPFSTFPSFNFLARSSNDLLGSNPFDVRHACNDPTERNEYQHMMTRDNLSRNTSLPVRPFPPCSACNNGQPRPTGPSNGLPNTHGRPERIE